jgi:hypothetical protein
MICRHEQLETISHRHKKCLSCGVWKGIREDAHHYSMEYYMNPVFGLFDHGITRRSINYSYYKELHFKPLGIDVSKFNRV